MGGKQQATTTTNSQPPPQVMAAYQNLINQGYQVQANNPYTPYPGPLVAGMTPDQDQALSGIFNVPNVAYPYLGEAAGYFDQAGQPIYEQVDNFMSPYIQNVVDATQAQFDRSNAIQSNNLMGQAIRAGNAFGGDREGIAQAELARNQQMAQAPVMAGLYNQGYQSALDSALKQGGLWSGLGTATGGLGLGYGNQTLEAMKTGLQGANQQQQTLQNYYNALQQQWMTGQAFPYQQTSWLGNLVAGLGSGMGGTSTSTQQQPFNLGSTLLGGGLVAASLPASFWTTVGSGLGALGSGLGALFASDKRLKENIEPVGKTFDGEPIYRYNMKGDPRTQIGMMAQDVEDDAPYAVHEMPDGTKMLDYRAATDKAAHRGKFQFGGGVPSYIPGFGKDIGFIPGAEITRGRGLGIPTAQITKTDNQFDPMKMIEKYVGKNLNPLDNLKKLFPDPNEGISSLAAEGNEYVGVDLNDLGLARGGGAGYNQGGGASDVGSDEYEFYRDLATGEKANSSIAGMLSRQNGGAIMKGYALGSGVPYDEKDEGLLGDNALALPQEDRPIQLAGMGDWKNAISGIESRGSGDYSALGPITRTGDRAYGKYQVMGDNVGPWTAQYFGQQLTPQEYLANKDAQEAVFQGEFGRLANKYGPEGAARAWFAGERGMNDPNRRDQLGTSVSDYAARFRSGMGEDGSSAMALAAPEGGSSDVAGIFRRAMPGSDPGGPRDEYPGALALDRERRAQLGQQQPQATSNSPFGLSDDARMALMSAGFAMMGARTANPFQAIGEGGLAGMTAYQGARKLSEASRRTQIEINKQEERERHNRATESQRELRNYDIWQQGQRRQDLLDKQGNWQPFNTPDGQTILINTKTGERKAVDEVAGGLQRPGTGARSVDQLVYDSLKASGIPDADLPAAFANFKRAQKVDPNKPLTADQIIIQAMRNNGVSDADLPGAFSAFKLAQKVDPHKPLTADQEIIRSLRQSGIEDADLPAAFAAFKKSQKFGPQERVLTDRQRAFQAWSSQNPEDAKDPDKVIQWTQDYERKVAEAKGQGAAQGKKYSPTISDETANMLAERIIAGDTRALVGYGRGAQGMENIAKVHERVTSLARQRGISGGDLMIKQAEQSGLLAAQRAMGTRAANVELAVQEARDLIPPAVAVSDRLKRTEYPTLNAIQLAVQRGTGNTDVVQFYAAVNALVNVYARAIQPVGVPTDDSRRHAREILSTAYSQGQFKGAVKQLEIEMAAAQQSPEKVRDKFAKEYRSRLNPIQSEDDIKAIKEDPSKRVEFEHKYGQGSADPYIQKAPKSGEAIPEGAAQLLREGKVSKERFNKRYGDGSAEAILGQ